MLQLLLLAVVESVDGTSAPCWGVDRVSRLVDVLHRAARVDEIGGVGARVNDDLVLATAPRAAYVRPAPTLLRSRASAHLARLARFDDEGWSVYHHASKLPLAATPPSFASVLVARDALLLSNGLAIDRRGVAADSTGASMRMRMLTLAQFHAPLAELEPWPPSTPLRCRSDGAHVVVSLLNDLPYADFHHLLLEAVPRLFVALRGLGGGELRRLFEELEDAEGDGDAKRRAVRTVDVAWRFDTALHPYVADVVAAMQRSVERLLADAVEGGSSSARATLRFVAVPAGEGDVVRHAAAIVLPLWHPVDPTVRDPEVHVRTPPLDLRGVRSAALWGGGAPQPALVPLRANARGSGVDTVLYLSRADAPTRRLDEALERRVIEVIERSSAETGRAVRVRALTGVEQTLRETAALMSTAVAIVGVHGGAMSNAVWADPARLRFLLELLPDSTPWMHFHHLAAAIGVRYAVLPVAGAHHDAQLFLSDEKLTELDGLLRQLWQEEAQP